MAGLWPLDFSLCILNFGAEFRRLPKAKYKAQSSQQLQRPKTPSYRMISVPNIGNLSNRLGHAFTNFGSGRDIPDAI